MWPVFVVVAGVRVEHGCEVSFAGDEDPVQTFASDGADPAFGVRVGAWRVRRCLDHFDAGPGEHGIEGGAELRVPVAQQEPEAVGSLVEVHQQIPSLLDDPATGRVGGRPGDVDLPGGDLDEEQHVDPFEEDRVDGEEVARQDTASLGGEELST